MVRIGNCSGFYGDRLSAMRELLEGAGGDQRLDYLTGDYLAELTMLILGKDTCKDPALGYARTFVTQVEQCLGLALEKGVKIVSNAGGLNPAGLAARLREVAEALGLDAKIAHVEGDDLRGKVDTLGLAHPDHGSPLTANAYLGAFGIAAALGAGTDVVVTGRVTDASLVVGPAIHAFGWTPEQYDELAGAVVAGHVIECGTQATGGNFSGFLTLPDRRKPLAFPVAEVAADGSCVITKQAGTGGAVTVDTVTAQLVYEIQTTRYLNPDVTVDLATVTLAQAGDDRVSVTGVRGFGPPEALKVCLNYVGGWRNSVELVLTGLDIEEKAAWIRQQVEESLGDDRPARLEWSETVLPREDAPTEEQGATLLRLNAFDPEPDPVGKGLTGPIIELALASYPGFAVTRPPAPGTPYGIYTPGYVPRDAVEHTVVHADGRREVIADPVVRRVTSGLDTPSPGGSGYSTSEGAAAYGSTSEAAAAYGATRGVPLGTFVYARSGDKGGDANLGLWVEHEDDEKYDARVAWLLATITEDTVRRLVPEAAGLDIEVYPLPNLGGVNVLVRGLLGAGVAATSRFDPQAKGFGEWLRSRTIRVPEELL
ncbi:exopolyphosphatase [Nocardioides gansuensis]|uniref:Exopolyphosphatase n=2 Tax=Nocardioides gansuensis TaxID=2138300 RepID=A0A2T8FGH5_9ACTN|nr:exopolyphosphatase [Nocardioides gansuensis]